MGKHVKWLEMLFMDIYILDPFDDESVEYQGSINGKRGDAAFLWFRFICRIMGISMNLLGYMKLYEIGLRNNLLI